MYYNENMKGRDKRNFLRFMKRFLKNLKKI